MNIRNNSGLRLPPRITPSTVLNDPDISIIFNISVPSDQNVMKKVLGEETRISRTSYRNRNNLDTKISIISTKGISPQSFSKHRMQINLEKEIHTLAQKSTILRTCNITRSVLNQK